MRTDLSSQIKLDRIPRRYYNPDNEIELTALRREEKLFTRIFETISDGGDFIASEMARYINRYTEQKGRCVLALGAGVSTHRAYASLIKLYNEGRVDFSNVIIYIIDEFFPLLPEGPSVLKRLREILLDHINIKPENVRTINPEITKETMYEYCQAYEQAIADDGGIDLAVFEIGPHGTVAFNEAGSPESSYCRLVLLGNEIRHIISKNYNCDEVPTTAITLGVANLRSAKRILTMAWGENSAEIVRKVVEGDASPSVPASLLQGHPHVKLVIDLGAAEDLTRISQPWKVTSCEWNDKLIRRAIVWLCNMTGKPILKLTDKDYNDWGLGELLALYGSAYNVNIKVFNELQHTITARRQTKRRRHLPSRTRQPLSQARDSVLAPPRRRRDIHGRNPETARGPAPRCARGIRNLRKHCRRRRRYDTLLPYDG